MKTMSNVNSKFDWISTFFLVALIVAAGIMGQPVSADVSVAPKNKPSLVITTLRNGIAVDTDILFFSDLGEADEFKNALEAASPIIDPLRPGKKISYAVTLVGVH